MVPHFSIWVDGFVDDSGPYDDERVAIEALHARVTDHTSAWILWKSTGRSGASEQIARGTGLNSLPAIPARASEEERLRQGVADAWAKFFEEAPADLVADVSQRLGVQVRAAMEVEEAGLARARELLDRLTALNEAGLANEESKTIIAELALMGFLDDTD